MNWLSQKIFIYACSLATRNEVPLQYSVGRKENDFTFFKFSESNKENSMFLLLRAPSDGKLSGVSWPDPQQKSVDTELQLRNINNPVFEIRRVYGSIEVIYSSILSFLLGETFYYHKLVDWRRRLAIFLFKRRFRFTRERMKILEAVVDWRRSFFSGDNYQNIEDQTFSHIDLYTHMYGWNAWYLEDYQVHLAQLRFILLSFVESGELSHGRDGFKLQAKCLETLSNYEEQKQKHSEARSQSRGIFWLTVVIAATALGQLGWNIFGGN